MGRICFKPVNQFPHRRMRNTTQMFYSVIPCLTEIVSALFAIKSHLVNIPYLWWEERSDAAEHDGVLSVTIWSVALNPSVGTSTVGGVEVVEKRFHSFWCIVAKELEACRQIIDRKQSQLIHHTTEQFNVDWVRW